MRRWLAKLVQQSRSIFCSQWLVKRNMTSTVSQSTNESLLREQQLKTQLLLIKITQINTDYKKLNRNRHNVCHSIPISLDYRHYPLSFYTKLLHWALIQGLSSENAFLNVNWRSAPTNFKQSSINGTLNCRNNS